MTYGRTSAVENIDAAAANLTREILRHVWDQDARKAALAALGTAHLIAVAAVAA